MKINTETNRRHRPPPKKKLWVNLHHQNAVLLTKIHIVNVISIKTPMTFFLDLEKLLKKFIRKSKKFQIAKAMLSNKRKTVGIKIPELKMCIWAAVLQTAWCWHKGIRKEQWYRIELSEMNRIIYKCQIGSVCEEPEYVQNYKTRLFPYNLKKTQEAVDKGCKSLS